MTQFVALVALILLLMGMHRSAVSSSLRYSRVAEGNISHVVQGIWDQGARAWLSALKGDAREWGRVRPFHWIYHSIPFALTLVRNGDLFARGSGVALHHRINGDLQTHVGFLLLSYGVAVMAVAGLLWRAGRAWWCGLVFAVCAWASLTLSENLLVFYCDSGEIGQILWISLYLLCVAGAFAGRVPRRSAEVLAAVLLVLAYGMKETSVVLLPVVATVLGMQAIRQRRTDRAFRYFCLRHMAVHLTLVATLLVCVHQCRAGAYVSRNYSSASFAGWHVSEAIQAMTAGLPVVRLLGVAVVLGGALWWVGRRRAANTPAAEDPLMAVGILGLGLSLAFVTVNLPWQAPLVKYYLPAHFFACLAAACAVAVVARQLREGGARLVAAIWIVGIVGFVSVDARAFARTAKPYYRQWYDYRRAVPAVAVDAAREAREHTSVPLTVRVVAGNLYQEGVLPFLRQANLLYGANIIEAGRPVHQVESCELNYFRIRPAGGALQMTMSSQLPKSAADDVVYVCRSEWPSVPPEDWSASYVREDGFQDPSGQVDKYCRRSHLQSDVLPASPGP